MSLNIDDEIIYSILNDDLARFKRIHPCNILINRPLKPYEFLKPSERKIYSKSKDKSNEILKNNTSSIIQNRPIKGPTALMFSILCERPSFCKYIIEKANPDLSINLNGFTAFHFACCTYDTRCLSILLRIKYIQENIDFPIIVPTFSNLDLKKQTTTALHLAVSNRLYKTVIILTIKPLPTIKKEININTKNNLRANHHESHNNNNNSENNNNLANNNINLNDDYSDNDEIDFFPCNVNICATSGSTPLHIALFNNDYEMCQILLHAGSDPSIKNGEELTCIEYARRLGLDEKFIKLLNDEIEPELIDLIIDRYFDEQEKHHFYDRDFEIDDSNEIISTEEDKNDTLKSFIDKNAKDIQILQNILQKKETDDKIIREDLLDVQRKADMLAKKPVFLDNHISNICCVCGSPNAHRCKMCGKKFCDICLRKKCHLCTV